jgi:hypothetical protein
VSGVGELHLPDIIHKGRKKQKKFRENLLLANEIDISAG